MTWVDWLIIIFVLLGILQGFWKGFVAQAFGIGSVLVALVLTFLAFPHVGSWLEAHVRIPVTYARPLSLVIIFFVLAFVLQFVSGVLLKVMTPFLGANPINRLLGAGLGAIRQLIIVALILTALVTLPTPGSVKAKVDGSRLAKPLIRMSLTLERTIDNALGTSQLTSVGYRIVPTEEKESTALNFTEPNPTEDLEGEAKMLLLTNDARKRDKKPLLIPNLKLREAAYAHGRDMLAKGYFSHLSSPDQKDVLFRVQRVGAAATTVGENLALAPSTEIAHMGLMASVGHRKNILSPDYNEIGIAVLDAGKHGKMVVEVFGKTY